MRHWHDSCCDIRGVGRLQQGIQGIPVNHDVSDVAVRDRAATSRLVILFAALTVGCPTARSAIHTELAAAPVARSVAPKRATAIGSRGTDELRAFRQHFARLPSRDQIEGYRANRDKSVVELQQFRELTRLTIDGFAGGPA